MQDLILCPLCVCYQRALFHWLMLYFQQGDSKYFSFKLHHFLDWKGLNGHRLIGVCVDLLCPSTIYWDDPNVTCHLPRFNLVFLQAMCYHFVIEICDMDKSQQILYKVHVVCNLSYLLENQDGHKERITVQFFNFSLVCH